MYYPNCPNSKEMSDRVHVYNRRFKRFGNTYANQCLYESIKDNILEFAYYVPQSRLGLAEEDASDFVLYIVNLLPGILKSYKEEAKDFYAYFSAVLDNRIKTYYRNRRNSEKKEMSAVTAQCLIEVRSFPTTTAGQTVSDGVASAGKPKLAKKLRFLALSNKPTQRRLFVYILTICPFLSVNLLEDFCQLLEINFQQTLRITERLELLCPQAKENYNAMCQRRNYYYSRSLELENEINRTKYYCDYRTAESYLIALNKIKESLRMKNDQIDNLSMHVNYGDVAKMLGIPRTTVGTCVHYSKNLILWCNDMKTIDSGKDLGLGEKLFKAISSGSWEQIKVNPKKRSILWPVREFNLNFSLNE